jgi:hypothetical protein
MYIDCVTPTLWFGGATPPCERSELIPHRSEATHSFLVLQGKTYVSH